MSTPTPTPSRAHRAAIVVAANSPFVLVAASLLLPGFNLLQSDLGFAGILASAGAFLLAFASPDRLWPAEADRSWRALAVAAAVLAAVVVLASLLGPTPAQTFTFGAEGEAMGAPTWLAALLVLVLAARQRFSPALHRAVTTAVVLGTLIALGALGEAARGVPVTGGLGNGDYLGMVMLLLVPLALVSARLHGGARRWAFVGGSALMSLAAIAGTSSAVIVALVGEWIALALFAPQLFGGARTARRAGFSALGLSLAVAVVAALTALLAPDTVLGGIVRDTIGGPTVQTRLEMWRTAYRAWLSRPILGFGPDGLQLASQHTMTLDLVRLESAPYSGVSGLLRDPHSLPLMVLVSVGVVGALAVIALAVAWVRAALTGNSSSARTAYVIAAVSFGACMLVMPWNDRFAALPALVAGMAIAPRAPSDLAAGGADSAPASAPRPRPRRRIAAWLLVAIASLLVGTAIAGDVLATVGAASPSPAEGLRLLRTAAAIQPTRPYLRFVVLYREGQGLADGSLAFDTYRTDVQRATELDSNGVYLALLAQPTLDLYRLKPEPSVLSWARERVSRAASLAPQNPDVLLERAHLAALTGDVATAGELLGELDSANVHRPRTLLYSYYYAVAAGRASDAQNARAAIASAAPELIPLAR